MSLLKAIASAQVAFRLPVSGSCLLLAVTGIPLILILAFSLCRAAFSPQRGIPGPFWARFTNLWYLWRLYQGHFEEENLALHKKYGRRSTRARRSELWLTAHRPRCSSRPEPLLLCRSRRSEGHLRPRCGHSLPQVPIVPACSAPGSREMDPFRRRGHRSPCQAPPALSEHLLHVIPGHI